MLDNCVLYGRILAIFIGYSTGVAPVVGYHYGAGNHSESKGLLKKSYVIIGIFAVAMFGLAELLAGTLAGIFVGYDGEGVHDLFGFFPVFRDCHLWIIVLYRAERWADFISATLY